jgi:hypothetical protein
MGFSRLNALDQALDIAGSYSKVQTLIVSDEPGGYGAIVSNQTGSTASISAFSGGISTITDLTGMTEQSVGRFLTMNGANFGGNNGTFLIIAYNSDTSVDISNPSAVFPETYNGTLTWIERYPYSLEDDLNYIRTDRKNIKGTFNWYDAIPTYTRPTATGTAIEANLANIAGKTTDAISYNMNKAFFAQSVNIGDGYTIISSTNNLKHAGASATDITGVPCFDLIPFINDWNSCYVHITSGSADGYAGSELVVLSGVHKGERIFGITKSEYAVNPDSIQIEFYSAPFNTNYATTATAYTWEAGQSDTINVLYGYNERLDQLDKNAFRSVPALGILTDAALTNKINDLAHVVGDNLDGITNLNGVLTNTAAYYPFFNLPDATPTVVEALNALNTEIGDRTYTGSILINGQTIAASLQALSTAMSGTQVVRTIERLNADILANTAHTLPGGLTYALDGTGNGRNLWIFTRGVLRDPGLVSAGNDYAETSSSSITFYNRLKSGDHINYFIKS